MGQPHRIHLGGAWEPPGADRPRDPWIRRFGRPAGLDADARVWLVLERPAPCTLTLNGVTLGTVENGCQAWRHEITRLLAGRNELTLVPAGTVDRPADAGGGRRPLPDAWGRPVLEIEAPTGSESASRSA